MTNEMLRTASERDFDRYWCARLDCTEVIANENQLHRAAHSIENPLRYIDEWIADELKHPSDWNRLKEIVELREEARNVIKGYREKYIKTEEHSV